MSDIVIRSENLGKSYMIGHVNNEKYLALRDVIANNAKRLWSRIKNPQYHTHQNIEEFWALKNIDFEIKQGDRVGIIGRNGAGKSTLLKIFSRITEPTTGKVRITGRIASLLEVGTGFHPELTGRENIYLNGAILGMKRQEIKLKFDEIVDFSGVERFLDTPVKRFSSGMYVRLAFAVAAHLEPEILIVDEVLAVGDVEFQKKCLGKMNQISEGGRTILFVSHNMGAIQSLTHRCILLENGEMHKFGETKAVVEDYLNNGSYNGTHRVDNIKTALEGFMINYISFNKNKIKKGFNQPLYFTISFYTNNILKNIRFGFGISNSLGARILTFERVIPELKINSTRISFSLLNHCLPPGNYSLTIGIDQNNISILFRENIIDFELSEDGIESTYLINKRDKIGIYLQPEYKIG